MKVDFPFTKPVARGVFLRRYKRFFADVEVVAGQPGFEEFGGRVVTVHCANSGSMKTCGEAGWPAVISDSGNPERKLRHSLELVQCPATGAWIGVNTATPNDAVERFVAMGLIPELAGYRVAQREVKYGKEGRSRIDLLLSGKKRDARPCYVEVKNVTMLAQQSGSSNGTAAFPDAVTERGKKHLEELMGVVREGGRAVMFFFIGRGDCVRMRPADEIDPAYGKTLRRAAKAGVELLAYRMEYGMDGVRVAGRADLELVEGARCPWYCLPTTERRADAASRAGASLSSLFSRAACDPKHLRDPTDAPADDHQAHAGKARAVPDEGPGADPQTAP